MIDARVTFAERMGAGLAEAGLPPLPSRVFSALLVDADGRMTSAELAAALHVSAGGVSGAVGYLSALGLVHKERERGSRRDVYVVDDDAWHDAMLRQDQRYGPLLAALDTALADLPDDDPAAHRLRLSRSFLEFVSEEMVGLAERWEARRRGQ